MILLIIFDLILGRRFPAFTFYAVLTILITTTLLTIGARSGLVNPRVIFAGMIAVSKSTTIFKVLFSIAALATLVMSAVFDSYKKLRRQVEFQITLLGLLLGCFLLVSVRNLLIFYLAFELVSLSSYILTTLSFDKKSKEAAVKYLLIGAASSAILLYGLSFLYGLTGSLQFTTVEFGTALQQADPFVISVVFLMIALGILFKVSAFPMHIWVPNVYESAPTPIVAFLSIVPKIAGLVLLINCVYAFQHPAWDWQHVIGVLAILSMLVGNLSALWQTNAKRMLAYSSIAHTGFLLIGVIVNSQLGTQSFLVYATVYFMMNFMSFFLADVMQHQTGSWLMKDWKGKGAVLPLVSVISILVMIALAGLPPTAGFSAKLLIFSALWEQYQAFESPVLLYLFIIGLFNVVISLAYYLKIPFFLFFKKQESAVLSVNIPLKVSAFAIILVIPLVILFFKLDWLSQLLAF